MLLPGNGDRSPAHGSGIFCFENPMDHYDPRFPEHSKFPIVAARMTHRKPDDCEERA